MMAIGPYIANGCMRSLRAIYNHARKTARSLPAEKPGHGGRLKLREAAEHGARPQ